ncbi:MAG: extracellular solute-binding protein [Lachnospiraceae bacterium]
MKQSRRYLLIFLCVGIAVAGLSACGQKQKKPKAEKDILTQKESSSEKTPITILTKNAFSINIFEQEVEKKFPQIDLIQVGNYTSDMGIDEYEARLKHGDLPDMVSTWPLEVGEQYWEEELLDLSAMSMTRKYMTTRLDYISREGKLYYLPGPTQIRGIVYNKTLFKEHGWEVPEDFDGFLSLCKEIEESGIRSLQLGLGNSEVLDTAFVGYGYEESFSKPENAQKIAEYNQGKGSFADNFSPALDTFQKLIDHGILKKEDLKLHYQDREQMLFTRQCAMVEDSTLIARTGEQRTGCTDEFGLMPFFNPDSEASDWARIYPVCYIGVNKHMKDEKNKEKFELVKQILDYISTPEGQLALAGDTGGMLSGLKGVEPPDVPEIQDIQQTLKQGRYGVFPTLKNAQGALREGLAGMVEGTKTKAEVIQMVDQQNSSPPKREDAKVIGNATKDFTLMDTGNFLTDAMRVEGDCEMALFLDSGKDGRGNGKGVSARFYKGDLSEIDVKRVLPDMRAGEKGELWKITMTGEDLKRTLEYAIPVDHQQTGWFYYFSGLRMEYDPVAEPGNRIHQITDEKGNAIDSKKLYSIAVMDETVPTEYIKSCDQTGILIKDVLSKAIAKKESIAPSEDGRFVVYKKK